MVCAGRAGEERGEKERNGGARETRKPDAENERKRDEGQKGWTANREEGGERSERERGICAHEKVRTHQDGGSEGKTALHQEGHSSIKRRKQWWGSDKKARKKTKRF